MALNWETSICPLTSKSRSWVKIRCIRVYKRTGSERIIYSYISTFCCAHLLTDSPLSSWKYNYAIIEHYLLLGHWLRQLMRDITCFVTSCHRTGDHLHAHHSQLPNNYSILHPVSISHPHLHLLQVVSTSRKTLKPLCSDNGYGRLTERVYDLTPF